MIHVAIVLIMLLIAILAWPLPEDDGHESVRHFLLRHFHGGG